MNLYEVLSEELETSPMCWDPPEPPEYGRCWHLVVADSPASAKYQALKAYGLWESDPRELPKCRVRKLADDVVSRPGIVSESEWALALIPESRNETWDEYISFLEECEVA